MAGAGLVSVVASGSDVSAAPDADTGFRPGADADSERLRVLAAPACESPGQGHGVAVGRAAGDTLATGMASGVLLGLAVVGALAFYWLQRLLGSDEESSR
jgi:hypothetical protein